MTTPPLPPARPVSPRAMTRPPRARSSFGLMSLSVSAGVLVSLVVVFCLVVGGGFSVWMWLGPDIDDAKAVANQYLSRIESHDDAAAYAMLCEDARARLTPASFTALVEDAPRPVSHQLGYGAFLDEPGNEAFVRVTLTDRSGATRQTELTIANDKPWQVCGDPLI